MDTYEVTNKTQQHTVKNEETNAMRKILGRDYKRKYDSEDARAGSSDPYQKSRDIL